MKVTVEQLRAISPGGKSAIMESVVEALAGYGDQVGLNTPLRLAHFLARQDQRLGETGDEVATAHFRNGILLAPITARRSS